MTENEHIEIEEREGFREWFPDLPITVTKKVGD